MTIVGVEMTMRASRETTLSETLYCLVAVQAPRATPPMMPTKDPIVMSRTETQMRVARILLTKSPFGVRPQSQWNRTFCSHVE